jgi:SAM-dependent methyltransferase
MISDDQVADHYSRPGLVAAIEAALTERAKQPPATTIEDLAPFDEFHVGGRKATKELLAQLKLVPGAEVLDVGCGLGGPARYCAREFGARVTGIDLSADYLETAIALTSWVELDKLIEFRRSPADDLPFKKRSFDAAYLLHVGMNVADKTGMFSGLHRVLRPGARLGVYDLMRLSSDSLAFPVPWAPHTSLSFVSTPDSYVARLTAAGFEVESRRDQRPLVPAGDEAEPDLSGLRLLLGESTEAKMANLMAGIDSQIITPYEIIAVRG